MRGRGVSTYRALLLFALAFAVSLAALAVAAGTAWFRCGRGDECSAELAFGIAAAAPAALLAGVIVLLIRKRSESPLISRVLLVVALGVAVAPLAAFVLRDALTLAAVALLFAALVYIAVVEDQTSGSGDVPVRGAGSALEPARGAARQARRAQDVARRVDATEERLVAMVRDLDALTLRGPITSSSGNGHHSVDGSASNATSEPITLILAGLSGFEDLAAIHNALLLESAVSRVAVRHYEGNCAWVEIAAAGGVARDVLRETIRHIAQQVGPVEPTVR